MNTKPLKTTASDVINLYTQLEKIGVNILIDGGWGVDALLGKQTRPHEDADIVIEQKNLPKLRQFLEARGYKDVPQNDTRPENFVLGDGQGHQIDVHVIVLDEKGNGIYGPAEKGVMYPAAALTGTGLIDGQPVRCISPDWLVKFHSGYTLHESDYQDVSALCKKFGIELPEEYKRFKKLK